MVLKYVALAAAVVQYATAQQSQQSKIVPQDLQSGFQGGDVEVQVSYENKAADGFKDGTQFEKDAVSKEPTFALGDSSGIQPTLLFTLIMVDTTCQNKRTLHYARANFANNNDITNIATDSAPLQAYRAPGAFGEKGDNRQYSFLMYQNPNRAKVDSLKLPAEGEAFDVKKFQTDNNFPEPNAGVGMIVKLGGGQADCGGGDQPNAPPANSASAKSSSAAARTSAADAGASSNVGSGATSGAVSDATSNAGAGSTSTAAAGASRTSAARRPSAPVPAPVSSSLPDQSPGNKNGTAPASSARRPSGPAAASSAIRSGREGPSEATSTIARGSGGAGRPAGSPTASGAGPVQQTTNAAPGLPTEKWGLFASLLAAAGLALW